MKEVEEKSKKNKTKKICNFAAINNNKTLDF